MIDRNEIIRKLTEHEALTVEEMTDYAARLLSDDYDIFFATEEE